MPLHTVEHVRIPPTSLGAEKQRKTAERFARSLSHTALVTPLAKVTKQVAFAIRHDLQGEKQGNSNTTSLHVTTTHERRTPTNLFKHGLPGSGEWQEWKEQQRREKEAQKNTGSGRGGGRGGDRPVAGGQGDEGNEGIDWSKEYHDALQRRKGLMEEAFELRRRGRINAARKKINQAISMGEQIEHYRTKALEAGGATRREIEQAQKSSDRNAGNITNEDLERAKELKEKRDDRGLSRKELEEFNKLKRALGDIIDDL